MKRTLIISALVLTHILTYNYAWSRGFNGHDCLISGDIKEHIRSGIGGGAFFGKVRLELVNAAKSYYKVEVK